LADLAIGVNGSIGGSPWYARLDPTLR